MKSYRWLVVSLLVLLVVVSVESIVYFRADRKSKERGVLETSDKPTPTQDSLLEEVAPSSVDELIGKTDLIKKEYSRNSDGSVSGKTYTTIRGNIYSINKENRTVLVSINFEHGWIIKSKIATDSLWFVNNKEHSEDYFPQLKKGDYIYASCSDDDCEELKALKVNTYQ